MNKQNSITEFHSVQFFREIKEKLSIILSELTFEQRKEFLRKLLSGEISISLIDKILQKEIKLAL